MKELHLRVITGAFVALGVLCLFFLPPWVSVGAAALLLGRILVVEWPRLFSPEDRGFWLFPIYPVLPFFLIMYLQVAGYELLNLMMITIVGTHDTGAYLVGKLLGATPLAPSISPNKTWEGFIGGCCVSSIMSLMFFMHNPWLLIIGSAIPLILSLNFASLAGDLFESMLKRRAGIKDSGQVLPGHGGLLDRVDGILFASILVFLARNWIMLLVL